MLDKQPCTFLAIKLQLNLPSSHQRLPGCSPAIHHPDDERQDKLRSMVPIMRPAWVHQRTIFPRRELPRAHHIRQISQRCGDGVFIQPAETAHLH